MIRLAVLISGSGTTLENLFEHIDRGELHAEIAVVISNNPYSFGLKRAQKHGVDTITYENRELDFNDINEYNVQYVVCAGWNRLLYIPDEYIGRVVNIHPSLLPAFGGKGYYGRRVHEAVLERGVKITGCTVHLCDNEYDNGPILMQRAVNVVDGDTVETLTERVQAVERRLYPIALQMLSKRAVAQLG